MQKTLSALLSNRNFQSHYFSLFIISLIARLLAFRDPASFLKHGDNIAVFLKGVGSDALVMAALSLILYAFRLPAVARGILSSAIVYIVAANLEHIAFNSSNLEPALFRYALHSSFVMGSALSGHVLWTFTFLATLFFLLQYGLGKTLAALPHRALFLAFLPVAFVLVPTSHLHPSWTQQNVFIEASANIGKRLAGDDALAGLVPPLDSEVSAALALYDASDLSGEPIAAATLPKTNVILIVVEALSARHLHSGYTPFLDHLADTNLYFRQFVNHQRGTTNGLYSLWCGDYPNLASMDTKSEVLLARGETLACLPSLLAERYATLFLQSAHLSYMDKDLLADAAGIEARWGGSGLPQARDVTPWGASDRDLFASAEKMLEAYGNNEEPFFLTVLNIGTHHPYPGIPRDASRQFGDERKAAFSHLDSLLRSFFERLDELELMDETLVLITSDESGFTTLPERIPAGLLAANHGIAIAVTPDRKSETIDELFTQRDVMTSILDYLGYPIPDHTAGRSIFRRYDTFRPVAFSNVFFRQMFALPAPDTLVSCDYAFRHCLRSRVTGRPMAEDAGFSSVPADTGDRERLFALARAVDRAYENGDTIFNTAGLVISETGTVYHERRMESAPGTQGEWSVHVRAPDGNAGEIRVTLDVRRFVDPAGRVAQEVDRTWILRKGESVDETIIIPFFRKGEIYNSVLFIETGSAGDEAIIKRASINRVPAPGDRP